MLEECLRSATLPLQSTSAGEVFQLLPAFRRAIDVVGRELAKRVKQSLFQVVVVCQDTKQSSFASLPICLSKLVVRDGH